jgi:hypothetical protein
LIFQRKDIRRGNRKNTINASTKLGENSELLQRRCKDQG